MSLKTVVLDFETYYSDEYSLSKMSIEEYVRDPRFQIIGLGLAWGKTRRWLTGTHEQLGTSLASAGWDKTYMVAHNTPFDGFILENVLGISPALYGDTLSMARPVHGVGMSLSLKKLALHYGIGEKGTEVITAKGKRREDFTGNIASTIVCLQVNYFIGCYPTSPRQSYV